MQLLVAHHKGSDEYQQTTFRSFPYTLTAGTLDLSRIVLDFSRIPDLFEAVFMTTVLAW